MPTDFQKELEHLINRHSAENGSDTPDFILAQFLTDCLAAWNRGVRRREKWYGREPNLDGGSGDVPEAPWTRNNERTLDLLALVADVLAFEEGDPDWGAVHIQDPSMWVDRWRIRLASWCDADVHAVEEWACTIHAIASDNELPEPAVPDVIKPFLRRGPDAD